MPFLSFYAVHLKAHLCRCLLYFSIGEQSKLEAPLEPEMKLKSLTRVPREPCNRFVGVCGEVDMQLHHLQRITKTVQLGFAPLVGKLVLSMKIYVRLEAPTPCRIRTVFRDARQCFLHD